MYSVCVERALVCEHPECFCFALSVQTDVRRALFLFFGAFCSGKDVHSLKAECGRSRLTVAVVPADLLVEHSDLLNGL